MLRRRAIQRWIRTLLAGATLTVAADARATPAPLGSEALYRWLVQTAAQALKASEAGNDLRPGGVLALNRGAQRGLAEVSALAPDWLAKIDAHLTLRDDLSARYGLRASRPLYTSPDDTVLVDTFGRLEIDQAGRASGELGLGLEADISHDDFAIDVSGVLDQEWLRRRERYTARVHIQWWRFAMTGAAFNETTMDEPNGALFEERLLDGLDLDLATGLPFIPWITVGFKHAYRAPSAPNAGSWRRFQHSIRLRPLNGLQIEAGSEQAGANEAQWFTKIRYVIKLGA